MILARKQQRLSIESILSLIKDSKVYPVTIKDDKGALIGGCLCKKLDAGFSEILHIIIKPEYKDKGHENRLICEIKSNHKTILAFVNQSEALFFRKAGFKMIDGHHC